MRELISMWNNTKMIVLTALTAGVYGAVLGPFKVAVLIPGITEIRPGAVVPVVFGILFGPAGAWGSGIGNVIGDFFGTLGPGSFFGFFGNFFYAFCAYQIWDKLFGGYRYNWSESRDMHWKIVTAMTVSYIVAGSILAYCFIKQLINISAATFAIVNGAAFGLYILALIILWGYVGYYFLTVIVASGACAFPIAWGVELLGLYPFSFLAPIITLNNLLMASILGPLLLSIIYSRVESWGLLWKEIMDLTGKTPGIRAKIGAVVMIIAVLGGLAAGIVISSGVYDFKPFEYAEGTGGNLVVFSLIPFIILFIIGVAIL